MKRIPQNQNTSNTPFQPLELVLAKVQHTHSGEGYSFRCPAHEDKRNSGYLKADAKGNVILKCFAGCSRKAICEALGLSESDLYVKKASPYSASQTIARYRYYDEAGRLLYEHQRLIAGDGKKTFLYCRTDATGNHLWTLYGGWFELKGKTWKRIEGANNPGNKPKPSARWFDESKRVLYRLSALRKAAPGSLVLYCEGEKDVENAEALGFVATTAGSASDWRTEFAGDLTGFDLVIIPDNDEAGYKCAAKVARDCHGKAARVRILALPNLKKGGDLSDWISAGGSREKLLAFLAVENESQGAELEFTIGVHGCTPIVNLEIDLSNWLAGRGIEEKVPGLMAGTEAHKSGLSEFTIGVHGCTPIVNSETDLSDLPEIEDDDPPVSDDPKREIYLRQLARNTAKVIQTCSLLLKLLGFKKDHTRLLSALIAIGGDRLNYFKAYQVTICDYYAARGEAASEDTVKRDLKKLRQEQAALGVRVISYLPGSKDLATGKGFASRFQNRLLRYALQAINISIDTRDEFNSARQALEAACQQVITTIPRLEKQEPKAKDKNKKSLTVEDLEARLGAMQEQLLEIMVADGWSKEEMEEEIELHHRRFYDRFKKVSQNQAKEKGNGSDEEDIYF